MELKINPNGKVAFMLKTGKHTVSGEMLEAEAKEIIRKGQVVEENGKIVVDGKFIFMEKTAEEKPIKEAIKEPAEKPVVEEPKEDIPLKEAVKKEAKKPAKKDTKKKTTKKKLVDDADKKPLSEKPLTRKKKK